MLLVASPGGGVWRSTNGGSTWTYPAQNGLGDNTVVHLEWDAARKLSSLAGVSTKWRIHHVIG